MSTTRWVVVASPLLAALLGCAGSFDSGGLAGDEELPAPTSPDVATSIDAACDSEPRAVDASPASDATSDEPDAPRHRAHGAEFEAERRK